VDSLYIKYYNYNHNGRHTLWCNNAVLFIIIRILLESLRAMIYSHLIVGIVDGDTSEGSGCIPKEQEKIPIDIYVEDTYKYICVHEDLET